MSVIRHKHFVFHKAFDDRVSALFYIENVRHIHFRAHVIILLRGVCKRNINVKLCYDCRRFLNSVKIIRDERAQFLEYLVFKRYKSFLCPENL